MESGEILFVSQGSWRQLEREAERLMRTAMEAWRIENNAMASS